MSVVKNGLDFYGFSARTVILFVLYDVHLDWDMQLMERCESRW